jgi:LmbE family N-acetylglucosaminyl deacetylase
VPALDESEVRRLPATEGTSPMTAVDALSRRIVVVSPHLDDAALSLGAAIANASAGGAAVTVLTVFAGDPDATVAAGPYDRSCGYATAGEAARARREEDRRACAALGAIPVWLPFGDAQYQLGRSEDDVWAAVAPVLEGATAVLVPGFPLVPPDHAWIARLILARSISRIGLYVEQPYAAFRLVGRGRRRYTAQLSQLASLANLGALAARTRRARALAAPDDEPDLTVGRVAWSALRPDRRARRRKRDALREYSSQIPALGRLTISRIALYEHAFGGEGIAWLDGRGLPEGAHETAERLLACHKRPGRVGGASDREVRGTANVGGEPVLVRLPPEEHVVHGGALLDGASDGVSEEHEPDARARPLRIEAALVEEVAGAEAPSVPGGDRRVIDLECPQA